MSRLEKQENKLKRGLKNRHMQMIALGTSVGTGLFYGSASSIQLVGSGIIFSYLLAGIFIFFIMRMVGEMCVHEPVSGSFVHFANKYWSEKIAYIAGWNYWVMFIIVSMAELAAIGIYMTYWLPDFPQWATVLIAIIVVTTINLIHVKSFAETEFWASLIKIGAIVLMIVFGLYLIFTTNSSFPDNFSNIWAHGGMFPFGLWGFAQALAVVMFAFGGVELIGITAGEAENPEKTLPKAINEVLIRILIFYVGTMVVLMALAPWNEVGLNGSPFVQIFSDIGIPAAANILNFVVIIAALSVYNSCVYSTSRILHNLAQDGNAPKVFKSLSANGTPILGILVSSFIALLLVIIEFYYPEETFFYLLSLVVASLVITWGIITFTHMKFRQFFIENNRLDELKFKLPLYPFINYFCILFLIAIILIMSFMSSMQPAIIALPIWLVFMLYTWKIKNKTSK